MPALVNDANTDTNATHDLFMTDRAPMKESSLRPLP